MRSRLVFPNWRRSRLPLCGLLVVSLLYLVPQGVFADARDLEFVRGLRQKRYFDYALIVLDRLEARKDLPADVHAALGYERAITHLEHSQSLRNAESRNRELDLAEASLEKFILSHPDHPLAGQASSERAQILLDRGRVLIWESRSPQNSGRKGELQLQARGMIAKARALFQQGHDRHKAEWDKLPRTPINPDNEKTKEGKDRAIELKAQRSKVETAYMRSQLDLALCTYEDAQTYNDRSSEAQKMLQKAADEFEQIHTKYRTLLIGLHARMWQGKCFEEQGDREIDRAIGLYNEILQHPGREPALTQLQHRVRQFRLICLNHDSNKDHQLAVQEATAWLVANKELAATPVGLGIRWERARAFEQLAKNKDASEHERDQKLKDALDDAREIHRYAGEFKDRSGAMVSRLNVALNREPGDPKDFDAAFGIARNSVNEIEKIQARLASSVNDAETQKIRGELASHLKETARLFRLALELAQPNTDRRNIYNAQFLLGFVNYELKHSYEAAILGDYVGRNAKSLDSALALEAAFLAFASWQQAHDLAPPDRRAADFTSMQRSADLIVKNWSDSPRAAEVRMTIGQLLDRQKQPLEAAKWYEQVPESADQFAAAQLAAGQAFWTAWLNAATLSDDKKPPAAELEQWQSTAEKRLRSGIEKQQNKLKSDADSPSALVAGRVSLAQILVSQGKYPEAIEFLTTDPHAPLKAIRVADEATRPAEGIKGRPFASLVYQLLLRAYVGSQRIDDALKTMNGLEAIAGGAAGESIAAVYVSLGKEIQSEIERLVSQKDDVRLAQVRDSFDQFLNTLFERRTAMSYGSLIWMAETYFGLGQGMRDDAAVARKYYQNAAATYEEILKRDDADDKFIPDDREAGVRLRLVNCLKRDSQFEKAVELSQQVLKELPRALDAQFEAASVLEEWGEVDPQKYLVAIEGLPKRGSKEAEESNSGVIWGWTGLASRLQRILAAGAQSEGYAGYRDKFADARWHIASCLRQFGLKQSGTERAANLTSAVQEVEAFALVAGDVSDESWRKFEELYVQLHRDLGQPAKPLKKPEAQAARASVAVATEPAVGDAIGADPKTDRPDVAKTPAAQVAASGKKPTKKSETGLLAYLGLIALLIAGTLGAFYYVNIHRKPKRKRIHVGGRGALPESDASVPQSTASRPRTRTPTRQGDKS